MGCYSFAQKNLSEMTKTPQEIRNELLSAFLAVDDLYRNSPTTSDADSKVAYLDIELSERLMEALNSIMFHYKEDVEEMRVKRKWGEEMLRAEKLLKKYAEDFTNANFSLKKQFDESGYLDQREFFEEASTLRPKLKRKI
jgi:hypothetical protein